MNENAKLTRLDQITHALSQVTSLAEVKDLRDRAEAVRQYIRHAHRSLAEQNLAAEAKLRAERRAGDMLLDLKLHGGKRTASSSSTRLNLKELGITWDQSARWQRLATITEEDFNRYIEATKAAGKELTEVGLFRFATHIGAGRRRAPSGKSSRVRERRGVAVGEVPLIPPDILEAASEIKNHVRLLESILEPLCRTPRPFTPHEQRVVPIVLRELLEEIDFLSERAPKSR